MGKTGVPTDLTTQLLKKKNKDKGGGTKKYGRNRAKCQLYRTHRSIKNKLRKLKRHLNRNPDDFCAIAAIEKARVQY